MRLIDADRLQKQFNAKSSNPNYRVNMHNIKSIITNAPTVEAIPKADYKARLRTDMVAMLTEIQTEIEELNTPPAYQDEDYFLIGTNRCSELIQHKINTLKESRNED